MARKNFTTPKPTYWVTIGGKSKEGVTNPTKIEGYYKGASVTPDTFNDGKMKTTFLIETDKGVAGVNGNANLIFQFQDSTQNLSSEGLSPIGMKVYIDYVGERKSEKKGRNPTKLFTVEFDPEDVKDVQLSAPSDYEELAEELDEEDESAPEALQPTGGQLSAAERAAKVQELRKNKSLKK